MDVKKPGWRCLLASSFLILLLCLFEMIKMYTHMVSVFKRTFLGPFTRRRHMRSRISLSSVNMAFSNGCSLPLGASFPRMNLLLSELMKIMGVLTSTFFT